jgi:hypothetical protein
VVEIVLDSGAFTGFGRDSKTKAIKENDNKKRNSDAVSFNISSLLFFNWPLRNKLHESSFGCISIV